MSIVLIGYRGSGKTTVGKKLADLLALNFVDVDDLIVQDAGKLIREIFSQHGEDHFRDLEEKAVQRALGLADHVIALGGGALGRSVTQTRLAVSHHDVVYLHCTPEELFRRITGDPQTLATRPNLTASGGLEEVRHLLSLREPIYRQAMRVELDVTNLTVDEVARRIAERIK